MSFYLPSRWIIKEWRGPHSLTSQNQHLSSQWTEQIWLAGTYSGFIFLLVNLQEHIKWVSLRTFMNQILSHWGSKNNGEHSSDSRDISEPLATMWSAGLLFSHTFGTPDLSWCYFCPLRTQTFPPTDFACDNMSLPKQRRIRTLALLFCIITFTTFLFSYTFRDPSVYFFKYAFRLSDNLFSKGPCACHQCIAELEDDPWFTEHFNQSIHPLMTRENSVLSDDTFKWWQVRFRGRLWDLRC